MPHISKQDIHPDLRATASLVKHVIHFRKPSQFAHANWVMTHFTKGHFPKDLDITEAWAVRGNGTKLRLLVARPKDQLPNATGVLWLHGGGYATEVPEEDFGYVRHIQEVANAVVVLPDYRLSTEAPYPAALDEAYLALKWLHDNATDLGVNTNQLFVAGESAGGGLTAALSLYARDKGAIKIAFQMPLYPMLDDRPTETSADNDAPVWNMEANRVAWQMYLGELSGTDDVPPYAAPARATTYDKMPPTYTFIGTIEPFYAETMAYIKHLQDAGVNAHVDVYEGAFRGFDLIAAKKPISKRATEGWQAAFKDASERYFTE
ncbi:alpha/beta hydrolase [Secundilactobacillus paracollinoides]|uniref:alpha/beta hydrolase n=1 Tax=Secundilactobacillus paracollinoides TaxID=240427 RepID=UPI000B08D403|nr:alpha/beta hydrolase [Secundilactobacillus paracollinoides]